MELEKTVQFPLGPLSSVSIQFSFIFLLFCLWFLANVYCNCILRDARTEQQECAFDSFSSVLRNRYNRSSLQYVRTAFFFIPTAIWKPFKARHHPLGTGFVAHYSDLLNWSCVTISSVWLREILKWSSYLMCKHRYFISATMSFACK